MKDKKYSYISEKETDQFLEEQFIKEAEEIEIRLLKEAGMESDEESLKESQEEIREGYNRLIDSLRENGQYRENLKEDKIFEIQEWKKEKDRVHVLVRRVGIAAACLLIVFMAGMTATADNTSAQETAETLFHIQK